MEGQKVAARDNARTPFQWNENEHAGFTDGEPWLKVNSDAAFVNVNNQKRDETSVLNFFRKMIKLRKELSELVYGKYELIEKENEEVYAYTRSLNSKKILIVLNFSKTNKLFNIPESIGVPGEVLLNNLKEINLRKNSIELQPYQSAIIRFQD